MDAITESLCTFCNELVTNPCSAKHNDPAGCLLYNPSAKVKSDGSSTGYYRIPPGATDLIDLIEHKEMDFAIGNIFKACYRLGEKHGVDMLYDLNKIIFFAERKKAALSSKSSTTQL